MDATRRPPKPLVFQILLVLLEKERHGYSIVREIEQQNAGHRRIEAGSLYRTLRTMLRDGLIRESSRRPDPVHDDHRRRYFTVTELGRAAAAQEARRLDALLARARGLRLLDQESGS